MTTSLLITVALIFIIVGAASIINRLWKPRQLVQEDEPAKIVDVAQIVTVKQFRSELYFFWFMFVIGTGLNTILTYASAETVFQEIAGLLLSIGNILFWGICIIVFTIEQKQTLYIYSESLTNLLDREERLPEVASSAKIASAASRVTMSEGGNMRGIADHIERQP